MTSESRKYPGQRFSMRASTFNDMLDTIDVMKANKLSQGNPSFIQMTNTNVRVRNKTGAARERFDVVVLDAPIIGPTDNLDHFKNDIIFDVIQPTGAANERSAVLQSALDVDRMGDACVFGITRARISKAADELYTSLTLSSGSNDFVASNSGVNAILWQETGTGVKWAVVCLSHSHASGGASATYALVTTGLSLGAGGHSSYTVNIVGGATGVTIDHVVEKAASQDMREYLPWYAAGELIPVVQISGEWCIQGTLTFTDGGPRSLTWNEEDCRAMAVWA